MTENLQKYKKDVCDRLHQQAVDKRELVYYDPFIMKKVCTSYFLGHVRAYCCISKCRHCPFDSKEEEGK